MTHTGMRHEAEVDRALVLGGSMAGLLAARALSESYGEVIVIERDQLPSGASHRRGVPQDRHIHGLIGRGQQILDELFPGFTDDLRDLGAPLVDQLKDARLYMNGHRLQQGESGIRVLSASRTCIESYVRQRVRQLPGVSILDGTDACGFVTTPDRTEVTGVRVRRRAEGSVEESLHADLVVDATGRGTRTEHRLGELGYPPPGQDTIATDVAYTTALLRLRPDALAGDLAVIVGPRPGHHRGGALAAIEGGRHILTLIGVLGDRPPTSPDGFRRFAASLEVPDIHDAIADAELLEGPVGMRFPSSVRRRYERMTRFPTGLVVLGDALCNFNPIYGQGIGACALQAHALSRALRRDGRPGDTSSLVRALAKAVDLPWDAAAAADLAFPEVEGHRGVKVRVGNSYLPRLLAAASSDYRLGAAFLRVNALLAPPESLFRPAVSLRVMASGLG